MFFHAKEIDIFVPKSEFENIVYILHMFFHVPFPSELCITNITSRFLLNNYTTEVTAEVTDVTPPVPIC